MLKDYFKFHCATDDVNPNIAKCEKNPQRTKTTKKNFGQGFSISVLLINSADFLQTVFVVLILQII